MAFEMKDNSGSLFRNDKKEKETHPDYKGQALIDGRAYWVSAWVKTAGNGTKFFSFSYKPKDEQSISAQATAKIRKPDPISSGFGENPGHVRKNDMDDDTIPF